MAIISGGAQIGGGVLIQSWNPLSYYLYTWGRNDFGQLGNGSTIAATGGQSSPGTVSGGGTTWSQVAAGGGSGGHTAAVKTDGTLWTWGLDNYGQLGDGTITNRSSPGTTINGGTTWSQVAAGQSHTAAIKTDGTLWTCGYNTQGQLGSNNATNRSSFGTTAGAGTTWSQVACGSKHTAAIQTNGTLWTWGNNRFGALGNGSSSNSALTGTSSPATTSGGGTTWRQVACGNFHTAAVKTDGTLWTCGYNNSGQLGNGTNTNGTSFARESTLATTWTQVTCGGAHTAAIRTDGTLWTWGYNGHGNLGNGSTTPAPTGVSSPFTTTAGGTTWASVACGYYATAAIKTDGTLWTCGLGNNGVLGNGSSTSARNLATVAGGGTTWTQVAVGNAFMVAIST